MDSIAYSLGNWRALHHHTPCWLVNIHITWPSCPPVSMVKDAMESIYTCAVLFSPSWWVSPCDNPSWKRNRSRPSNTHGEAPSEVCKALTAILSRLFTWVFLPLSRPAGQKHRSPHALARHCLLCLRCTGPWRSQTLHSEIQLHQGDLTCQNH